MSKKNHTRVSKTNPLTMELGEFRPLTQTQAEARLSYAEGKNLFLCGYAGTGKTYIALNMALEEIRNTTKDRICIFRSAVATRDIGFLPGTEAEKLSVFERPYPPMVNDIFGRDDAYEVLKTKKLITFESTSYQRGTTLNDCVIIFDEVQNCGADEMNTIITRFGNNCRIIVCGDHRQTDLPHAQSGFKILRRALEKMEEYVAIHEFDIDDVVRSGLVKAWIIAYEEAKTEF